MTEPTPEVVAQIIQIEQEAFGEGGMNYWFVPPFVRHGKVFILVSPGDKQVVAVAEYMRDFNQPKLAYLFGFAVAKTHQGKGLAKQLLKHSLDKLHNYGIDQIRLTVAPTNERAVRLYQRFGFHQYSFMPAEYGPGADRIALELVFSDKEEENGTV